MSNNNIVILMPKLVNAVEIVCNFINYRHRFCCDFFTIEADYFFCTFAVFFRSWFPWICSSLSAIRTLFTLNQSLRLAVAKHTAPRI